jgi:MFS family permease
VGLLGLLVFFRRQQRIPYPIFEVSLFLDNRPFAYSSLAALLNYSATFAVTFLMSLYLQYIKGMSPQAAGALLMVQPVMMAIFSPIAGRLSDSMEPRLLATGGMVLTVAGMLVFTQLQPETSLVVIAANLLLLGFGFALFSSPNMSAIMGAVPREQYGIASGAAATMRLMGQMVSMAIATVVLALLVGRQAIEPQVYGPFLSSIKVVFTLSALLCAVGIYFSLFRGRLLPSDGPGRSILPMPGIIRGQNKEPCPTGPGACWQSRHRLLVEGKKRLQFPSGPDVFILRSAGERLIFR